MILIKKSKTIDIIKIDPFDNRWFDFSFVRKYDHIFNAYPAFIFKHSLDWTFDGVVKN